MDEVDVLWPAAEVLVVLAADGLDGFLDCGGRD